MSYIHQIIFVDSGILVTSSSYCKWYVYNIPGTCIIYPVICNKNGPSKNVEQEIHNRAR